MFLIVDTFGGYFYATIVTNDDGENMAFETREAAEEYAKENLQIDGFLVIEV